MYRYELRVMKTMISSAATENTHHKVNLDILHPLRAWIENFQVKNSVTARRIAQLVPSQCPFERNVQMFGRTIAHIPPLCKLNPLYEEIVGLRFRALCYLADECGEDITAFI